MAKPKPKQDDKEQSKRFIEKARELEADESDEAFERAFKKIIPAMPGSGATKPKSQGYS